MFSTRYAIRALSLTAFLFGTAFASSSYEDSVRISPVRETAISRRSARSPEGLELALKRYARPGAQPLLLIHGLSQNDRIWDSPMAPYSFARFLYAQGFDVWMGNLRGVGTPGFRSETPPGPHHWTVEDYAVLDIPALVAKVRESTGRAPFLLGHSLAAWAFDGYFAGLEYDAEGGVRPNKKLARRAQSDVRGVVTIAGIYNVWWPKSVWRAVIDPVLSEKDFYQSNYELELAAQSSQLYNTVPYLPTLPLNWLGALVELPLDRLPWIGAPLALAYRHVQRELLKSPVLNMFYYAPNTDPEMVRTHGLDGMGELGPKLLEQLANAANERQALSAYHGFRPRDAYEYESVRSSLRLPMLFVGGGRDRCANYEMIYQDGYLKSGSRDKQFLAVELAGHLDLLTGKNAAQETMAPVAKWLLERSIRQ